MEPPDPPTLADQIAEQYARLRAAKHSFTNTLNPGHRADLRATICETTESIWRLQRRMQESSPQP